MEIIKTKKEQEREARNQAIMDDYCKMLQEHPEARPWRILRTIADKHGLTPEGVKLVLVSMGAYIAPEKQAEEVEN